MQIQLMMVDFVDEIDEDDQGQMLMMMFHYMDMKEEMKKIRHPLLMDYYQMELENSIVKKKKVTSRHMDPFAQLSKTIIITLFSLCIRIKLKVTIPSVDIHTPKKKRKEKKEYGYSQDINTLAEHTFLCLTITA